MHLEQLIAARKAIQKLRVLSFEMNIYLVEIELDDFIGLVRDESGKPQRFHSVAQIKDIFGECNVQCAELVHETPYDEMIGNPPGANNQMILPLQFNSRV